ncbi:MAG: PHP domain-containing protein [Nitrospirota bacterium]|nr:MAG: PHP domain-containing protein [Nitrospirota bacterium]
MADTFRADLHIHSCLSPCSELDMTPRNIVKRAKGLGLDIIAVADHNTAQNVDVTDRIASAEGIIVVPAMEITSSEEVHLLALFGDLDSALGMQKIVLDSIAPIAAYKHDEQSQPIVNENDEVLSFNPLPLINATSISLSDLVRTVHERDGIAIACHIDREAFSIISQLGFVPEELELDAVEVSPRVGSLDEAISCMPGKKFPLVSFSDSHHPSDIGRRITEFTIDKPTPEHIIKCLRNSDMDKIRIVF